MLISRRLIVCWIVVLATVCAFFSRSAETSSPAVPTRQADVTEDVQSETDLYGNDVSDAVARYTVDANGALYEVHSPQTEIPRLGSPES